MKVLRSLFKCENREPSDDGSLFFVRADPVCKQMTVDRANGLRYNIIK